MSIGHCGWSSWTGIPNVLSEKPIAQGRSPWMPLIAVTQDREGFPNLGGLWYPCTHNYISLYECYKIGTKGRDSMHRYRHDWSARILTLLWKKQILTYTLTPWLRLIITYTSVCECNNYRARTPSKTRDTISYHSTVSNFLNKWSH